MLDADGTLVGSSEIDGRLYREAVETELRIEVDDNWSCYRYVTGSGIMDEADGCVDRPLAYARIKEAFVCTVADHIGDRGGRDAQEGPVWPVAGATAPRLPAAPQATFPISARPGPGLHGSLGRDGPQAACPVVSFRGRTFST